jgi:hypothetical protein
MEKSLAHQNASEANTAPRQMGNQTVESDTAATAPVSDDKTTAAASAVAGDSGVATAVDVSGDITVGLESLDVATTTAASPDTLDKTSSPTTDPPALATSPSEGFPGTGWKGMVEVYDLGGLGMAQIHVKGLRMVSRVLGLGQAHYPENLRTAFFINTPTIFKAVWSTLKLVLDKNTVSKIHMTRHNNEAVLKSNLLEHTFDTVQNWHPPGPPK